MERLKAQDRVFEIVNILLKNHIAGISNKALAKEFGTTEATVCRDMALFEKYKWAIRSEKSAWRLSPEFGKLSGEILRSYQTAKLEIAREEAEYLSAMN